MKQQLVPFGRVHQGQIAVRRNPIVVSGNLAIQEVTSEAKCHRSMSFSEVENLAASEEGRPGSAKTNAGASEGNVRSTCAS